ncbi:hypothetical protein AV530_011266 [Patagioenas fasciata monilis]|uniref:Uncharacterized protein n=1 Tax=Patagioenas fasciata monilis TaxID=372326 RepID=A0A1V4KNR6_PATFA|nr:hypothetical protein AV530_011266 [Patagioenas fasciata monilis]
MLIREQRRSCGSEEIAFKSCCDGSRLGTEPIEVLGTEQALDPSSPEFHRRAALVQCCQVTQTRALVLKAPGRTLGMERTAGIHQSHHTHASLSKNREGFPWQDCKMKAQRVTQQTCLDLFQPEFRCTNSHPGCAGCFCKPLF